jgi:nucleosome binding factor SPN SPT16 subunit
VQDWLTSIEIKYYESKVNLNWKNIVKSIKEVSMLDKPMSS